MMTKRVVTGGVGNRRRSERNGMGVRKEGFTVRNSLSRRGGYRGGCGAKEGEDLERRTPKRFHRLLLRCAGGCAWERTKVIDGSVGSDERILSSLCGSYDKEMDEAEETGQREEGRKGTGRARVAGWEGAAVRRPYMQSPDHHRGVESPATRRLPNPHRS
jgi:hypothetical protein